MIKDIFSLTLDLASIDSVRQFCCDFDANLLKIFDYLKNNEPLFTGEHFEKDIYYHIKGYSLIAMIDFWIENKFEYMAEHFMHSVVCTASFKKLLNETIYS